MKPAKKLRANRIRQKGNQSGIALFMVISTLALLSVLLAELTYSSQMNARMAYNFIDNTKAYYIAKAGFRLSMIRLKAFHQVRGMISGQKNDAMKNVVNKNLIDKIWNIPFMYPLPIPKEATNTETETIKAFQKSSNLKGSFTSAITGQSSRLNLNLLFVKQATADRPATGSTGAAQPTPAPATPGQPVAVKFRDVLEPAIESLIEQKKTDDKDFAANYRNLFGKDVVDAIEAYLLPETQGSNLPGFKEFKPKLAPFYSLSELHLIPGIDDEIFNLIEPMLTVYSTPGVEVNSISKNILLALIPEMTSEEADEVIRKRDDPQVGQPFKDEQEFWGAIGQTSAAKSLSDIQQRFKSANVKIVTEEQSFKIGVLATVGQSSRRLEAYVVLDSTKPGTAQGTNAAASPSPAPIPGQPGATNDASAKKPTGVNLIYWRML